MNSSVQWCSAGAVVFNAARWLCTSSASWVHASVMSYATKCVIAPTGRASIGALQAQAAAIAGILPLEAVTATTNVPVNMCAGSVCGGGALCVYTMCVHCSWLETYHTSRSNGRSYGRHGPRSWISIVFI
eukprot:GHRR01005792.1.p2 GENE.GHRR01005792.1~~GHRR01005792.1.p2  ORF type:complete len:130 (+),score=27.66 GHRR01005792.1:2329-2718(+)